VRAFVPRSLGARASRNAQFSIFCVPGTLKSAGPSRSPAILTVSSSLGSRFASRAIRRFQDSTHSSASRYFGHLPAISLSFSFSLHRSPCVRFRESASRKRGTPKLGAASSRDDDDPALFLRNHARWGASFERHARGLCAITHLSRIRPRRGRNRKSFPYARGIVSPYAERLRSAKLSKLPRARSTVVFDYRARQRVRDIVTNTFGRRHRRHRRRRKRNAKCCR